eukprot:03978.XXX_191539_191679_1 [CDS] Oithona nana genome sequencing.
MSHLNFSFRCTILKWDFTVSLDVNVCSQKSHLCLSPSCFDLLCLSK